MYLKNYLFNIMRLFIRKRNFQFICYLFFGFFLIFFTLNHFILSKPYYEIEYPHYTFILEPERPVLNTCNPFNKNNNEFKVIIDGEQYPQKIPLFYNQSINFSCLNSNPKRKTILLWNKFGGLPNIPIDAKKTGNFLLESYCPVTNCDFTSDQNKLNSSDMILFHMRSRIDKFPAFRFSNQKWVYLIYESQQHCPMCSKLDNLFNLSATFSSTSDISSIYYSESRLKWTSKQSSYNESRYLLSSKPGFAVILISDCDEQLNRLNIVKVLRKYIPVDIYGKCSDQGLKCPEIGDCREFLAKRYKFFLSFENSICKEYVTEKFFNTLNYDTIPIVLGAGEYSKFVPKSAFINLMNYPSIGQFAEYLMYLSLNQTAYSEYFKWKQYVHIDKTRRAFTHYCEMCIGLQMEEFTGIKHKVFINHSKLFKLQDNCHAIKIENINGNHFLRLENNAVKMSYLESS